MKNEKKEYQTMIGEMIQTELAFSPIPQHNYSSEQDKLTDVCSYVGVMIMLLMAC